MTGFVANPSASHPTARPSPRALPSASASHRGDPTTRPIQISVGAATAANACFPSPTSPALAASSPPVDRVVTRSLPLARRTGAEPPRSARPDCASCSGNSVMRPFAACLTLSGDEDDSEEDSGDDDPAAGGEAAERRRRPRGRPIWPERIPDDWVRPRTLDQSPLHPTEIALAQAFSDGLTELGDVELCTRCDEGWPLLNVNADGACQRCQNATSRHARMFRSTNYRCGPARLIGRVLTRQVEAWPSLPSCTICLCRRR